MKMFKKAVALLLAVAFIFTLSACHPKDEVAISAGDYKITSAMYSYFLVMADSEAKNLINSNDAYDTKAKGFKYTNQTIEGKSYTDYVKEQALNKCLRYLTIAKLADEAKVELDEKTISDWQGTATYYWMYAYGSVFSQNGISYATYEKLLLNEALYNEYFDHLYLEGGEKEMPKADIQKNFDNHYSAVYMISHDYSTEKEPDIDKIKEEMGKYKTLLEQGKTLKEVQDAYDADHKKETTSSSSTTTSSTSSSTSTTTSSTSSNTSSTTSSEDKEEEKKPVDQDIVILTDYDETTAAETTYFKKYSEVAKLKTGEAAVIADSDDKKVYVILKKDINSDPYYLEELTGEIVYMVNGDGFDKFLTEESKKLEYTVNDYAVDRFKVKKIKDGTN